MAAAAVAGNIDRENWLLFLRGKFVKQSFRKDAAPTQCMKGRATQVLLSCPQSLENLAISHT